jgi:hypothetical protein
MATGVAARAGGAEMAYTLDSTGSPRLAVTVNVANSVAVVPERTLLSRCFQIIPVVLYCFCDLYVDVLPDISQCGIVFIFCAGLLVFLAFLFGYAGLLLCFLGLLALKYAQQNPD